MVKDFTTKNFENDVLKSELPVLVEFWASWCGPCQKVAPILEDLSKDVKGLAVVGKLNVDSESEIADDLDIMSIPTLVVFKEGKVYKSMIGVQSKETLKNMLDL
ncbi:MAG: thioredoxin [Tenericutes bacterium]|jgi:thioredoxin 1|nr:thioredoxin [Mycoplasmatota bacterium]